MEKVELYIVEKAEHCELINARNRPLEKGDCEKIFYKAMAEAQKRPTEIVFLHPEDGITRRIFVPEDLQKEELDKRERILWLTGTFLKKVAGVPASVYEPYFTYIEADELYNHLIDLLELTPWPEYAFQEQMKFERGDEVGKRDNIVFLTGEYLRYYYIYADFLYAPFFRYPVAMGLEELFDELSLMIRATDPTFQPGKIS